MCNIGEAYLDRIIWKEIQRIEKTEILFNRNMSTILFIKPRHILSLILKYLGYPIYMNFKYIVLIAIFGI